MRQSILDKIERWLPAMLPGKKLDKGRETWRCFRKVQSIRDLKGVHVTETSFSTTVDKFCEEANLWRHGVAGFLFDLHKLFDDDAPYQLIRSAHTPQMVVKKRTFK